MVPGRSGDVDGLSSPDFATRQRRQDHRGMDITPQLAIWPVYRGNTKVTVFQQKLQASCSPPGERSPHSHMTHCSQDGLAGVLKGITIPFQNL